MLRNATTRRERGMVLVTALILLAVLTLVAVVAMRTTTLDLRMATNVMLKARAFESSEGTRVQVPELLDDHVYYRGWPGAVHVGTPPPGSFNVPNELKVLATNRLYEETSGLDMGNYADAKRDLCFWAKGDCGSNPIDKSPVADDISSDMFITNLGTITAAGAATAMVSGYEGHGKGSAAGGSYVLFDLRSRGHAAKRTESLTGSDVRVVVRN